MLLQTTTKARLELHPGVQTLSLRQRSLLLLADRHASAARLRRLFNGMGGQLVSDLLRQGYLEPAPPAAARPAGPQPLPVEPADA